MKNSLAIITIRWNMKDKICIEFYELSLKTLNVRKSADNPPPPPPIHRVDVRKAFLLLEANKAKILCQKYHFNNKKFLTGIEHIAVHDDHIDLVLSFYDGTAPNRTVEERQTASVIVQVREENQDIKHLCHIVIKFTGDDPEITHCGIERLVGFPSSKVAWCLRKAFNDLRDIAPEEEGIFQITNPDGIYLSDGTEDIRKFKIDPAFYPLQGTLLEDAVIDGRLRKIRLTGKKYKGLDDPSNKFTHMHADLEFVVKRVKIDNKLQAREYIQEAISSVSKKSSLIDMKTFVIIEQEDNTNEQSIQVESENDDLKSAFVKRRWFDALDGRCKYPDNTQVNNTYLSNILELF